MRFSTWLIGLLFIFLTFIAFAGTFMHLTTPNQFNVTVGETFQSTYTNTTSLASFIEDTTNIGLNMTNESKTAKQIEDEFDDPTKSQLRAIKLAYDGFGIVKSLLFDVANFLHIPPVIVAVVTGVIIFALLFAFISLIFRFLA